MTGRWAATNTLRKALTSEGAASRYYHGRIGWEQFHEQVEKERAALALVETALDAAARAEDALRIHGRGVELIGARVDLAAALRPVLEGK